MGAAYELSATVREKVGKGAARSVRRQGMTPAVIYGGNQPPIAISLPARELSLKIHGGGFYTTVATIDVGGEKVQTVPRDYQLDPVSDKPMHVDFLRVTPDSTITIDVPVQFINESQAPGIKRGGVLNVVRHRIVADLPRRRDPREDRRRPDRPRHQRLAAHLRRHPAGRRAPDDRARFHHRHGRRSAGVKEEMRAAAEACRQGRRRRPPRLPAEGAAAAQRRRTGCSGCCPLPPSRRPPRSSPGAPGQRREPACCSSSASAIPARNMRATGTMSASWPSTPSTAATASRRGGVRFQGEVAEGTLAGEKVLLLKPQTYMNEFRPFGSGGRRLLQAATCRHAWSSTTRSTCRPARRA